MQSSKAYWFLTVKDKIPPRQNSDPSCTVLKQNTCAHYIAEMEVLLITGIISEMIYVQNCILI